MAHQKRIHQTLSLVVYQVIKPELGAVGLIGIEAQIIIQSK